MFLFQRLLFSNQDGLLTRFFARIRSTNCIYDYTSEVYFHFTLLFAPISVRSSSRYLNQPSTMITKHQTPSQNDPKSPKRGKETHHLPKPSPPPSLPNPAIPLLHPPFLPPHKLFQPHNPQPGLRIPKRWRRRHQRGRIHRFPIPAFACPRLFELDDFIPTNVPETGTIE